MIEKKILVVVDVSNLYLLFNKVHKGRLDYNMLLMEIGKKGVIQRAIAYGADFEGEATAFRKNIEIIGFETKYKRIKSYYDPETGRDKRKADWDVGIAIDVVQILDQVDAVAFVTADGDMFPCLEYVRSRGKLAYVYGTKISLDLKLYADYCLELGPEFLESNEKHSYEKHQKIIGLPQYSTSVIATNF